MSKLLESLSNLYQVEVEGEGFLETGDGRYLSTNNGYYYLSYHGQNFKGKRIEPTRCRKKNACYFHIDAGDYIHLVAFGIIGLNVDGVYWVAGDVIGYVSDPEADSGSDFEISDFENECDDVVEGVGKAEESGEGMVEAEESEEGDGAVAEVVGEAKESGEGMVEAEESGEGMVGAEESGEGGGDAVAEGVGEAEESGEGGGAVAEGVGKAEESGEGGGAVAEVVGEGGGAVGEAKGSGEVGGAVAEAEESGEGGDALLQGVGEDRFERLIRVFLEENEHVYTPPLVVIISKNEEPPVDDTPESEERRNKWRAEITKRAASTMIAYMDRTPFYAIEKGNKLLERVGEDCFTMIDEVWLNMVFDIHTEKEGAGAAAGSLSKSDEQLEPCTAIEAEKEGAAVDAGGFEKRKKMKPSPFV